MAKDWLKGIKSAYDTVIIGSGLAGLTAANKLAKLGHKVLILEHHYNLGGLATWFKRKGGHILDISLHGFPTGMIKTCRKYWTKEISDSILGLAYNSGLSFKSNEFANIIIDGSATASSKTFI